MAERGDLLLVLHAHLPWVLGHGTWPHGEEWLFEAAAESYLPLVSMLRRRAERSSEPALGLGVTPILAEMLADERFHSGFVAWLERKVEAAVADAESEAARGPDARLAGHWERHFRELLDRFEAEGRDLLRAVRELAGQGVIELLGGPATHPYGPLMSGAGALRLQYDTGRRVHRRRLGHRPRGAWMPECGYRPAGSALTGAGRSVRHRIGMEEALAEQGIEYSFVESHLVSAARVRIPGSPVSPPLRRPVPSSSLGMPFEETPGAYAGVAEVGRAYRIAGRGATIAVFARDPYSAEQVWSGRGGYPGDPAYLEFHKRHHPGGHRYWRVTDDGADLGTKQLYRPADAAASLARHARHFVRSLELRVRADLEPGHPVICAPYDAELFGHWWHEGVAWLEAVLAEVDRSSSLRTTTPGRALEEHGVRGERELPPGSWGEGGDHRVWQGESARPGWESIEAAEARCRGWWSRPSTGPLEDRFRRQAARTLLLLQASDWPFLLDRGQAADYAQARIDGHAADLAGLLDRGPRAGAGLVDADLELLARLEDRDRCFQEIEPERLLEEGS